MWIKLANVSTSVQSAPGRLPQVTVKLVCFYFGGVGDTEKGEKIYMIPNSKMF